MRKGEKLRNAYKIRVRNCPEWENENVCSVEISVGNENQEGEKLSSLLAWVNDRFDACIINVADTLQRHNLIADGMTEGEAHLQSVIDGNQYIFRNLETIEGLSIPYKIIRWSQWTMHEDFEDVHQQVKNFYMLDEKFTELVDNDVRKFLKRNDHKDSEYFKRSVDFILEEAAAHILMGRIYSPVCLYPGKRLESLDYIAQTEVPECISGLDKSKYARVVLNRRGDNALPGITEPNIKHSPTNNKGQKPGSLQI
jgi:tRNA-dependent cyclodipeptide synthase